MILVSKAEMALIQKRYRSLYFACTRHHYYMEQRPNAVRYLKELRGKK